MENNSDFVGFLMFLRDLIKKAVQYIVSAVKKNFVWIVVIFLAISGYKIYYSYTASRYYKATMGCYTYTYNYKLYGELIKGLSVLINSGSYNDLANVLKMPADEVRKIKSIEATNNLGIPLIDDQSDSRGAMIFTVVSADNKIYASLQEAIMTYIRNNPANVRMRAEDIPAMTKKIAYIDKDLSTIDSVINVCQINMKKNLTLKDSGIVTIDVLAMLSYKDQLEDKRLQQQTRVDNLTRAVDIGYGFMPAKVPFLSIAELTFLLLKTIIFACVCGVILRIITDLVKQ